MRCVKDTLPPRLRARWLLITIRLSISSFAGTARTVVAVGTVRDASMLAATAFAGPRSLTTLSAAGASWLGAVARARAGWAGMGFFASEASVSPWSDSGRPSALAPDRVGAGAVAGSAVGAAA